VQAHNGNGRTSHRSAIGGHPSARRLIDLCIDHEELSLEANIPVANLFAWPSCRTHQPCSLVGFHHRSLSAHNFKLLRCACKPLESQAIENVLSPLYSRSVPASNGCGDFTPRMVQQGSTFAAFSMRLVCASCETRSTPKRCVGRRASAPAVSSIGGLRTPADEYVTTCALGRHPQPFTKGDISTCLLLT
jgi:hypothetical protein